MTTTTDNTTTTTTPLAYWREEIRLDCAASLGRLRRICEHRGADYAVTVRAVGL